MESDGTLVSGHWRDAPDGGTVKKDDAVDFTRGQLLAYAQQVTDQAAQARSAAVRHQLVTYARGLLERARAS